MKKLILVLLVFATMGLCAQEETTKDRIFPIKIDTTQVDSSGVISEFIVDYEIFPVETPDTLKGVVLNINQIEMNIVASREMIKIYRREKRSYESDFEGAVSAQAQNYLKGRYKEAMDKEKQFGIALVNEVEKRKAFRKLIK